VPLIDEHVRDVGREVRELARLHGELAQTELYDGLKRLAIAIFLLGVAVATGGLGIAAASLALYFVFTARVSPPAAAGLVGAALVGLAFLACFVAWRVLKGSQALFLPRTRAMVWELLQWRDDPKDS
jgi:hypothetical protein